ncbi:MAG TPA: hypothetical protein VFX16_13860 [Pseudonocardiaceae bacterium]|nr:hypothetical protein [Pseudonocardiaceae bacterium]
MAVDRLRVAASSAEPTPRPGCRVALQSGCRADRQPDCRVGIWLGELPGSVLLAWLRGLERVAGVSVACYRAR